MKIFSLLRSLFFAEGHDMEVDSMNVQALAMAFYNAENFNKIKSINKLWVHYFLGV